MLHERQRGLTICVVSVLALLSKCRKHQRPVSQYGTLIPFYLEQTTEKGALRALRRGPGEWGMATNKRGRCSACLPEMLWGILARGKAACTERAWGQSSGACAPVTIPLNRVQTTSRSPHSSLTNQDQREADNEAWGWPLESQANSISRP